MLLQTVFLENKDCTAQAILFSQWVLVLFIRDFET